MRSTGSGLVWDSIAPWTYGFSSTYTLVIRDFTGDGRADLAGRHTGTGDFFVARSTGSAFTFLGTWATGVDSTFEIR